MADAKTEVREETAGHVLVRISGLLDAQSTGKCWRDLEERLQPRQVQTLEVDASGVVLSGGIGAALLRYLCENGMTPGARTQLRGLSDEAQTIFEAFSAEDFRAYKRRKRRRSSVLAEIGSWVRHWFQDLGEQVTFLGSISRGFAAALIHPRRMRWGEVFCVMETAGANALPIVSVINLLVGMVIILEASHPLAKFGAQIFLADMIGFSSLRNTAPVVTAILLAGRSGAAFAAELGTMKVNQELDALNTMGLNPIRFLVLQRITAAVLLTPLLAVYGMLMGILGGVLVMRSLGFPPLMIYHQMLNRVGMNDFWVGVTKAALFGVVIGAVACLRGLQTGQGPSAVGVSTTRSVIACILLIIVLNTLYSSVQYFWA